MPQVVVAILDPHTSEPQANVDVEARKQSDGTVIAVETTNIYGVATFNISVDATFHARTSDSPPLYQVTFPGGGMGPFGFDYLVDDGWATEVAAGRGTEGQTFSTFHGQSFKVYSKIQDAIAAANTAGQNATFFIAPGTYTLPTSPIVVTPPSSGVYRFMGPAIEGDSRLNSILPTFLGSLGDPMFDVQGGVQNSVSFENLRFIPSNAAVLALDISGLGLSAKIYNCTFELNNASNVGIEFHPSTFRVEIKGCAFGRTAGVAAGTIGILGLHCHYAGRTPIIIGNEFLQCAVGIKRRVGQDPPYDVTGFGGLIANNDFESCPTGIEIANHALTRTLNIHGNHFKDATIGINFTLDGSGSNSLVQEISIHDNTFNNCTTAAIDFSNIGANGFVLGASIVGNDFWGWAGDFGIRGHATKVTNSILEDNNFFNFDSGKEITVWSGSGNEAMHNISQSYAGVKQALADVGEPVGHVASSTPVPVVDSPTYDDLEDMNTAFHSAGWISGGAISDVGSENITIAAGTGAIRSSDSRVAQLLFFDWAELATQAIATDTVRYIGVEYNAGSPRGTVRTTENWNFNTDFPLGIVTNEGGTLHIQQHEHAVGDMANWMIQRMHQTVHVAYDAELGGNILGESADTNRRVTVSAGAYWVGLSRFATGALDTDPGDGADTFATYSAGGQEAAAATQWPNEQYDNAGTLANMTGNRWANLWWYQELDGHLLMVYGTAQYVTEAQAEGEALPTTLPARAVGHGALIGRMIFQKSAGTAAQVLTAFITMFATAGVTDHGGLVGLGDDDHTQYVLRTDSVDAVADVDTVSDAPALNEVLKWDGSNWVPGTAGDTTEFTFSIDSFTDNIADTNQLIGAGEWKAIGAITFEATYSNAPGGMTAEVALSGSATPWVGNLAMTPVTGPETNTEAVDWPAAAGGTITFTLSQDADGTTDTETVTFNNTMRYGTNALTQGNQTEVSLEALSEVAGPNESRSQTIANIPADAGKYLTFAYADRLSDVAQVRRNHDGQGYITASFAAAATTLAPDVQGGVANVDNSNSFSETFACITSRLASMTDGSDDFQLLTTSTPQNYIYWGELNQDAGGDDGEVYSEADVEDNIASQPGRVASNSISSRSMTVNAGVTEYTYIAYPARLGALSSILIGGFESIGDFWIDHGPGTELAVTNDAGYQENYYVYVSKNPGFTDPTTMTVSL